MGSTSAPAVPRPQSFLTNVLWNWVAVAANIFASIVTRYLIRKLGDERYGIWALTFSLIEYIFLFDLGFRSAVVTFVSRRRTQGDTQGINEISSMALAYFSAVAVLVCALTLLLANQAFRLFQISAQYRDDFSFLIMLLLYPAASKASAQDKTPLLRQLHAGISPGGLKIAVRNSQIVVWECEACSLTLPKETRP